MKTIAYAVAALGLTVGGCASSSGEVRTTYAMPQMYQGYNCQQLAMEDARLRSTVAELKGNVDKDAANDKMMVGIGVAVFWPALFLIHGNGEAQAQYAEMKGEHEALQQVFIMKNCQDPNSPANAVATNWTTSVPPLGEDRHRY